MAASDNLSHKQLAMYMTAKELKEGVNQSADPGGRYMDHLWDYKLTEAKTGAIRNARYRPTRKRKGNTLYESIEKEGVRKPVEVVHHLQDSKYYKKGMQLSEGHHRVAAAYAINPNMIIPVENKWAPSIRFLS